MKKSERKAKTKIYILNELIRLGSKRKALNLKSKHVCMTADEADEGEREGIKKAAPKRRGADDIRRKIISSSRFLMVYYALTLQTCCRQNAKNG